MDLSNSQEDDPTYKPDKSDEDQPDKSDEEDKPDESDEEDQPDKSDEDQPDKSVEEEAGGMPCTGLIKYLYDSIVFCTRRTIAIDR